MNQKKRKTKANKQIILSSREIKAYASLLEEMDKLKSIVSLDISKSLKISGINELSDITKQMVLAFNKATASMPTISTQMLRMVEKQNKLITSGWKDVVAKFAIPLKIDGLEQLKGNMEQLASVVNTMNSKIPIVSIIEADIALRKQNEQLVRTLQNIVNPITTFLERTEDEKEESNKALQKLKELEVKLNYPEGYFSTIFQESGRWMILKLHLIIQHLLVEYINKRFKEDLGKSIDFKAISTWHFKEIFELAVYLLGEKKGQLFDFCNSLSFHY